MKVLPAALTALIVGTETHSVPFASGQECTVCDDKPTPIMVSKGGQCGDYPNIIRTRCKDYSNWRENQFCRQTCFMNGRGYDGDDCCLGGAELDKPAEKVVAPATAHPTPSPTPGPTDAHSIPLASGQECTVCDDKPTPIMVSKGGQCGDYPNIIRTRCKDYSTWRENQFCRQTCFMNGRGYDGDACCHGGAELEKPAKQTDAPIDPTACSMSSEICDDAPCCDANDICVKLLGLAGKRCIANTTPAPPTAGATPAPPAPAETNGGEGSCTICDDKPTPIMANKNKPCSAFPNVIASRCYEYDNWAQMGWCRHTCFMEGRGYKGDECCPKAGETIKIPTIDPKPDEKDNGAEKEEERKREEQRKKEEEEEAKAAKKEAEKEAAREKEKDDGDKGSKTGRLKMYCENRFQWQGKDCREWCLEAKSCSSGATLRIRKCSGSSGQKWKKDGNVLRPSCSNSLYVSDGQLKKGSGSVDGLSSSGKPFEIKKNGGCLTNHHHPRDGEEISFRPCDRARRSDTAEWHWD